MVSGRISARLTSMTKTFVKPGKYWQGLLGKVIEDVFPRIPNVPSPRQRSILEALTTESRTALDRLLGPDVDEWTDRIQYEVKSLEEGHIYSAHLILVNYLCFLGRSHDEELADRLASNLGVLYRRNRDAGSLYRMVSQDFPGLPRRDQCVRVAGLLARAIPPAHLMEAGNRFPVIRRLELIVQGLEGRLSDLFSEETEPSR